MAPCPQCLRLWCSDSECSPSLRACFPLEKSFRRHDLSDWLVPPNKLPGSPEQTSRLRQQLLSSACELHTIMHIAYRIMHYIPRNESVRPHQVSHRVKTFDTLLKNNLYRFLQRCASSSNSFIRSVQMHDAFYKSSSFLIYLTFMYDGDQLIYSSCWCVGPVYVSHQYCFSITTKSSRAVP